MNKNKVGRKFGRMRNQRKALFTSLINSLIVHEKIITTEPKAKEIRRFIEPMISRSKLDTISNRRLLSKRLNKAAVKKLFSKIGPRYKERRGGYVRLTKHSPRRRDSAKMAVVELL